MKKRRVLVVDVGGTNIKVALPGSRTPIKVPSGPLMTAAKMAAAVKKVAAGRSYDVVSIGYPGPVVNGRPAAEPRNLAGGWRRFDFRQAFRRPVRIINDAAMQALGSYQGGRMLFLGLGTGLGSALVADGVLEPLELAHLPYRNGRSYEDYVGLRGFKRPASAEAILHPPVRERVANWGYLIGIGILAIAIGVVAIKYVPDGGGDTMAMGASESGAVEMAVPDRTIPVQVTSDFRFAPDAVTVTQGETIAFVVTNDTDVEHEFVIGDEAVQAEHETEMADGTESMADMGDKPYAIDVPAHSTVTLVYTFDEEGDLIMGCHVPGHYAAGMRGTITVEPASADEATS